MERVNLLCETLNCGKSAVVFGIKEALKVRSCEEHIASLVNKKLQICDIMGYSFISSVHDVAEFEERKTLVEKGRGNAIVLEMNCESELQEALQAIDNAKRSAIESIEQRFEEIKAEVTETCNEIKNQFAGIQRNFEQFLISRERQLSPSEQLICGKLSVIPQFLRFEIIDVSSHISAMLSNCWFIPTADIHSSLKRLDDSQKKVVTESALAEATEFAKKGIHNALRYVNLLSGEEEFGQPQVQILAEILKFEKTRIDENLKWLQHTWNLRQRCRLSGRATVKVGRSLAALLCQQLGQFAQAERILRLCNEIMQAENPLSEDSMTLCTDICEVHVASAQFQLAEELTLWALKAFATAGLPSECYWTALFYLTDSMRQLGKRSELDEILEYWRNLEVGNKLSEMLQLLIYGSGVHETENKEEAKWLLQARRIGTSHFPTSTFTALACFRLALVSNDSTREELHKLARSIYEVVAPKIFYATVNLTCLGEILQKKNQFDMAEKCYQQAKSFYEITAPNSIYAAKNFCNMAAILEKKAKWDDAIDYRLQAWIIYEFAAQGSIDEAINLTKMGVSLGKKARYDEAIMCHQQACGIYGVVSPQSAEAAYNFSKLAGQLEKKEQYGGAEECFKQARFIYGVIAPKSIDAASNLNSMASFYVNRECWKEAEESFRQARFIYEVAAPRSIDAASNLNSMASFYDHRKYWEEAEECYRQARSIYEVAAPKSIDAARNSNSMALFYCNRGRWKESEECYRQARSIYEVAAPKSIDTANNLSSMALFYYNRKSLEAAEECHRQAQSIYDVAAPRSIGSADNLKNMGALYYVRNQWNQAEKFFRLSLSIYEEIAPKSAKCWSRPLRPGRGI